MIAFRLTKKQYSHDVTGYGAELYGGRWNKKGVSAIYAAESRALAFAEVLARLDRFEKPVEYVVVVIQMLTDKKIRTIKAASLPNDWAHPLRYTKKTVVIGTRFLEDKKNLVLKIPSAIIKNEFNYLINPALINPKNFIVESIEPFDFDDRFFEKK